jgi:hypothetical protein
VKRLALAVALVALPLSADELRLRGGGKVTGAIIEENSESITVDIGAGTIKVPASSVDGIDKSASPLQEYRAQAAKLASSDIDGWRKLGRWAQDHGLSMQAHEAYQKVHDAHPADAEANNALGLIFVDNHWVTEEQAYSAKGYVKFQGEWMMPAEATQIVRERDAAANANREAVKADVAATEAVVKEREKEQQRQDEEYRRRGDVLPVLGDPLGWGWQTTWP